MDEDNRAVLGLLLIAAGGTIFLLLRLFRAGEDFAYAIDSRLEKLERNFSDKPEPPEQEPPNE